MRKQSKGSKTILKSVLALLIFIVFVGSAQSALVLYYPFNEGSGTVAHDKSVNLLHGTLKAQSGSSLPIWTSGPAGHGNALLFGTVGGVASESGKNFVGRAYDPNLDLQAKWTVAAWVRVDNDSLSATIGQYGGVVDGKNYIFQVGSASDQQMYSWPTMASNNGWQFGMGANSAPEAAGLGVWHHVAFTFDFDSGGAFTYYLDGVVKYTTTGLPLPTNHATQPWNAINPNFGDELVIGAYREFTNGHTLCGAVDDVAIWNGDVLDVTQINTIKSGDFSAWPLAPNPTNCNPGDPLSVQALMYGLPLDWNADCYIDFKDFALLAKDWLDNVNPEQVSAPAGELLTNFNFEQDQSRVPAAGQFVGGTAPTSWRAVLSPPGTDPNTGIENTSLYGDVANRPLQPQAAGGTVSAYLQKAKLYQIVPSPAIVNGQKYYLSAMYCGYNPNRDPLPGLYGFNYQNQVNIVFDAVTNPTTIGTVVPVKTITTYNTGGYRWRHLTAEYTADGTTAGKYFRVSITQTAGTNINASLAAPHLQDSYVELGDVSITTNKPSDWPGQNLITNGDFEDVSNLPDEWYSDEFGDYVTLPNKFVVQQTDNGWFTHSVADSSTWPVGWTYESDPNGSGLQSMLWAASPQPSQGRISIYLDQDVKIHQKVTSETIIGSTTYYLDMVAAFGWSAYNDGTMTYPADANIIAEVYWLAPGQNGLTGTQGVDWDLIKKLSVHPDGALGANGGHWSDARTTFTTSSAMNGKSFFVKAYGTTAATDTKAKYATIDEVYLGKTPRPTAPSYYTCASAILGGLGMEGDFNADCVINFTDLKAFVLQWLNCNNPLDTNCTPNW